MTIKEKYVPGLEGIIASETAISFLDTVQEKIIIKGEELIALSKGRDYLDVVHLLLEGELPSATEKVDLEERLKQNYELPEVVNEVLKLLPKETHPMDAQRTGISVLAGFDENLDDRSTKANKNRAYKLLGNLPTITVNSYRILNGQEIISPKKELSYSANFLAMITGKIPSEMETKILTNCFYYIVNTRCPIQRLRQG